jgi:hypothetical protein
MYSTRAPVPRYAGNQLNAQRARRLSQDSGMISLPTTIKKTTLLPQRCQGLVIPPLLAAIGAPGAYSCRAHPPNGPR